jgi:hypothetical protein
MRLSSHLLAEIAATSAHNLIIVERYEYCGHFKNAGKMNYSKLRIPSRAASSVDTNIIARPVRGMNLEPSMSREA